MGAHIWCNWIVANQDDKDDDNDDDLDDDENEYDDHMYDGDESADAEN